MLVLSRKEGEKILIGDDIEVVVVRIKGDKVRIGIVADEEVPVDRSEVGVRKETEPKEDANV